MDQAASVFSQRDSGLLISFVPRLAAAPVTFPTHAPQPSRALTFLIAQSYVAADKRVTGPVNYNLRVVECTLAALYLSRVLQLANPLPSDAGPLGVSLRGLQDSYFAEKEGTGVGNHVDAETYTAQLKKLMQLTHEHLPEEGYTREDIGRVLGMSVDELNKQYTTKVPVRAERFKLRQRALHVFSEALRVQRVMQLLREQGSAKAEQAQERLGAIVSEVHASCRDQYECSCPELDQLCAISIKNGGWGARVTGAGWGGCSVHLVPAERAEQVRKVWKEEYYDVKFPGMSKEKLEEAVVVSKPGRGSLVFEVDGRREL